MGFLFSKNQTSDTNIIENDVVFLICKVAKQETTINRIIKEEILNALEIYANEIQHDKKRKNISPAKARGIQNLINEAKQSVQRLASQNISDSKINSAESNIHTIKANLLDIAKKAEKNTIDEKHCEESLRQAIFFTEKLQKSHTTIINKADRTTISIGFLRLFLKCPQKQATEALQENVYILHKCKENFDQIQIQNVSAFNVVETENKLLEIMRCSETITELSSKELKHINKKWKYSSKFSQTNQLHNQNYKKFHLSSKEISSQPETSTNKKLETQKLLKSVKDSLEQQKALIENLCPPVAKTLQKTLKKEIDFLQCQFNPIITVNIAEQQLKNKVQNTLDQLKNKLKTINEATKEITEKLNLLENIKNNCLKILQSSVPYFEKIKQIDACKKEITDITLDCSDFDVQKTNVLNSIDEVIIAETACYMKQLCIKINRYKLYSAQFPFPTRVNRYYLKKVEIKNLLKDLDQLPKNYINIEKRKQQLKENVYEVVNVLTEQANRNERVISALEKLEEIKSKINHDYEKREINLFNTYRNELELISNDLSEKIFQKKIENIELLHAIEAEFIPVHPEIQKIKTYLNEREKEVQLSVSNEVYQQRKNELKSLIENVYICDVIKKTASFVLEMFERNHKKHQMFCNKLKYFDQLENNLNTTSDKKTLEDYENELNHYEKIEFNNDLLCKIRYLKEQRSLKKCFFDLSDLYNMLEELGKNIDKKTFISNIDTLFYIKETIEDMPKDDSKLEIYKNEVLNKVCTLLQSLDENLAKIVFNRKQPETFLDLKDHFTFDANSLNVSRNSVEFVTAIQDEAKTYESDVLYFLGSTDCIDFYIIRENLSRLLKMLDTVECGSDPDLLQQVVEAIEYIKNLTHQLNLNANEK